MHSEMRSQRVYEIVDCAIDVRYRASGILLSEELGAKLARECPIEIIKERSWKKKEERNEERDSSLELLTRPRAPFLSPRENSYFRRLFLAVHPHSAVGPRGTRCRNPEKETAGWWLLLIYGSINHIRHLHSAVANFARRRDHPAIFHLPRLRSRHGEMRGRLHPRRRVPLNFPWNSRTYGRLCGLALRVHTRGDLNLSGESILVLLVLRLVCYEYQWSTTSILFKNTNTIISKSLRYCTLIDASGECKHVQPDNEASLYASL